jgi:iron complex transport system substrate-binding protein
LKPLLRLPTVLLGTALACAPRTARPGPLAVVDDAGDTVRLAAPATRVVSLSPATTELVFALGAGDRLVGRTRWGDYPAAAAAVPSVGDGMPPNVEAVFARRPDLVLLYRSPGDDDAAARLREAGIAVLQVRFDRLSDVSRLAVSIGTLLGRRSVGDSLARAFDASIAAVRLPPGTPPGPRVLVLAWDQPPMAIGAGSFQSEILTLAGGRNVFADIAGSSAPVSIESIASRNPDLVLVTDSAMLSSLRRPQWQAVPAVRQRRFLFFSPSAFGRPGPRAPALVLQLRQALAAVR